MQLMEHNNRLLHKHFKTLEETQPSLAKELTHKLKLAPAIANLHEVKSHNNGYTSNVLSIQFYDAHIHCTYLSNGEFCIDINADLSIGRDLQPEHNAVVSFVCSRLLSEHYLTKGEQIEFGVNKRQTPPADFISKCIKVTKGKSYELYHPKERLQSANHQEETNHRAPGL
ncbi:hypothetical protein [Vibrio barjaei]|uniref:hypothetical protein n=1 Tax=Vibrio barjaei TaxID=1676683 RepID=UPI002284F906|nr:hypothetical protein [Vibrio barjaei]MCY9874596.1 hypothetical protein [Vibrio barjaei]